MNTDTIEKNISVNEHYIKFVEKVRQFLVVNGWKDKTLAVKAGVSPSLLSQFLSGKYSGDINKTITLIADVIESYKSKKTSKSINPLFISTSVTEMFFAAAKMCREFNEMSIVYSDAGIGKTESSREYIARNPTSILIESNPGYSPTVLFRELYKKIGGIGNFNLTDNFTRCIDILKDSDRLLIIDEAEHLTYRALEYVRRLHDHSRIGVLLTGMKKLLTNMYGYNGEYDQLHSRAGIVTQLNCLQKKDTENIVKIMLGDTDGFWEVFHKLSKGNARRLFKLMRNAKHIAEFNGYPMALDIIERANQMMTIMAVE